MAVQSNSIGALSRETNVKVTTIRYYESIGLLEEPYRTASGRRTYGPDSFERLRFIRHARDLGFSVDTIRELIELQSHESEDCSHADELARRHLVDVQTRIGQLRSLEGELERMIEQCKGGSIENCAILNPSLIASIALATSTKLDIMIGGKPAAKLAAKSK